MKALHTSRLLPISSSGKLAYILTHKEATVSLATSAKDSPELPLRLCHVHEWVLSTDLQVADSQFDSQFETTIAPGSCADTYRAVPTE